MDFSYNDDQRMLQDSIDRYLTQNHDFPRRQRLLEDAEGAAQMWREMAELGWIGAAFPEEVGGFGSSPVDALAVAERLGRHLVAQPFVITAMVCGRLLLEGLAEPRRSEVIGGVIAGDTQLALLTGGTHLLHSPQHGAIAARRSGDGYVIDGRMPVVINADRANLLLVAARTSGVNGDLGGVSLFLLDAEAAGVSRRSFRMIDGHGAAEVVLQGVQVGADALLGEGDAAAPMIDRALDYGVAGVCGEALGAAAYLVDATAEYTKQRVQYGQPLAKFQVLQHRMADMYIAAETARSMAYFAALSLEQPDQERGRDLSAAKAQVGRAAKFVGQYAVQLHGGMGVSEELDIGHHYMRLVTINQLFGDEAFHLERFDALCEALDAGLSPAAA